MRTDQAQPVRLSDYRVSDYLIDTVELDVDLARNATHVTAKLGIRLNPHGRPSSALVLDGDELVIKSAKLDGRVLAQDAYLVTPDHFTLLMPPGSPFVLEIETLLDPAANLKLMGLYRSGSAYCTQCEAEGFRRITYFLDRPDILSIYTVRIEADQDDAPVLLSNGNLVGAGLSESAGRHYAVWYDPHPKPCYLFALVGGRLGVVRDTFTTMSGRMVDLGIYVEPGKEDRADYAMDALKRSMRWDEEAYGREYDLDVFNIVAVSDFNMGAMENKGLNVFNDKYVLASPTTATDADYAGIETVIAHEYFHNWTGNRVTCRDWFQLCLKEGLTVFRDHEFSADMRSRSVRRIADVRALRSSQFPEDAGPLAHNVRPTLYREINNFYTATIYEKGAEIIRMLKVLIGAQAFRAGMDLYFERCDGTATTIEVFLQCFAETSCRDLGRFARWYHQSGTPHVKARFRFDGETGSFSVDLTQSCGPTPGQDHKDPFVVPIAFGLVAHDGKVLPIESSDLDAEELERGLIILTEVERTVTFKDLATPPVPSLLRGLSAPVVLTSDIGDDDLLALVAHDSDSFNRWEASQSLALRLLRRSIAAIVARQPPVFDPAYGEALGHIIDGAGADHAFAAQALALPSESDIARDIGQDLDHDAIHAARDALRTDLGLCLGSRLIALYQGLVDSEPYSPLAASAGRRALRNTALDLYAAGDRLCGVDLAQTQFETATNMTDKVAALAILAQRPGIARETALTRFYEQYSGDALVVDKWFSLQATQPEPGVLETIRTLMEHQAFSLKNPNRVRALIGAFAAGNLSRFNAAEGSGFDFVADMVIALDGFNAQVAARLLSSFKSWRSLESGRRGHALLALQRVAAAEHLSRDVADIVTRSLA